MIIEVQEFVNRVSEDLPNLVSELQAVTGRFGDEESDAWKQSLPRLARAFSSPGFAPLHLYINGTGALSLEYQLPAASAWCDVVLLGKKGGKSGAVIIELKHWQTSTDSPGEYEGLVQHFGQPTLHPSDQVRGYAEYCRRFHSAVIDFDAIVSGCVLFTKDTVVSAYRKPPNDLLTEQFPCFTLSDEDLGGLFPVFVAEAVSEPDIEFAKAFETGYYKQDRGFVRQIGDQILDPRASPFELLDNQRRAFALCRAQVNASIFGTEEKQGKKVIVIEGPPGSGKSVVAAKIWATLATDKNLPEGPIVFTSTSASQYSNWSHLFSLTAGGVAGSGVVKKATSYSPITTHKLGQLRKRFEDSQLFGNGEIWRENLKTLRALGEPFLLGARDGEYLVSVVDEAHALINPEHVEGRGQFGFVTGLGPQAYHIIRVSQVSIFLLDSRQGFRTRENTTITDVEKWAREIGAEYATVSLEGSQFRCAGSKEYVDWIEAVLGGEPLGNCQVLASAWNRLESGTERKVIDFFKPILEVAEEPVPYITKSDKAKQVSGSMEFQIFENPKLLEDAIREKIALGYSARLLSSYAREWKTEGAAAPHDLPISMRDFIIPYKSNGTTETWSRIWNYVPKGSDYKAYIQGAKGSRMHSDALCEVGCPYAVRGFDWDYVGILWFSDLVRRNAVWRADPKHVHESGIKTLRTAAKRENDPDGPCHTNLREAIVQAYRILLTRPLRGVFVWFEDEETRNYIESTLHP